MFAGEALGFWGDQFAGERRDGDGDGERQGRSALVQADRPGADPQRQVVAGDEAAGSEDDGEVVGDRCVYGGSGQVQPKTLRGTFRLKISVMGAVRLQLDVARDSGGTLTGHVTCGDAAPLTFTGWIGLTAAIDAVLSCDRPPAESGGGPVLLDE